MFAGVRVRLTEDDYTVNEDEGTVEVCVVREGETTAPITVTINTGETSPPSATGERSVLSVHPGLTCT